MIKSADLRLFQIMLQEIFQLKSRINFRKNRVIRLDGDSCFALYEGYKINNKKFSHTIRLATSEILTNLDLFATMAHEYVHAWQMENDKEVDHDKESGFDTWRDYFLTWYNVDIVSMEPTA